MEREYRYFVLKIKDIRRHLSKDERRVLLRLASKINAGRINDGKGMLECVCVESDWPEYEPTWAAIAARVDEVPNAI